MRKTTFLTPLLLLAALTAHGLANAQSETSLYDSSGEAVAYIAHDDLTIYLWSGKPVAYLRNGSSGVDVYGFDGKHLGWFEKGYVRTNDGDAACGVRAVIPLPHLEPLKSLKSLEPIKSIPEIAPIKPIKSMRWSKTPCGLLLSLGADD